MFVKIQHFRPAALYRIRIFLYYIYSDNLFSEDKELKESNKKMSELIKKSGGLFWKTVLLVLLPVLVINCYIFYSNYGSVVNDYTKIDAFDFDNVTDANYLTDFTDALLSVQQAGNTDLNATDIVFYILNIVLSVFIDGFLIIFAVYLMFHKEYKIRNMVIITIAKCFSVIFFGIIASWALSYVTSAADSTALMLSCFARAAAGGSKIAPFMLGGIIASSVIHGGIAYFLLSGVMMLVSYCTIAGVSGACRWFVAPQYVFEILRGKKFRQMLHFLLPTLLAYFIPCVLNGLSMYTDVYTGLVITAVSVTMQTVFSAMLWFRAVPDFYELEKESGIKERIRDFKEDAGKNINE